MECTDSGTAHIYILFPSYLGLFIEEGERGEGGREREREREREKYK